MTEEEFELTARHMEVFAIRMIHEGGCGSFQYHYWMTIKNIALAYQYADSSNRRIMRTTFAAVFMEFNKARLHG